MIRYARIPKHGVQGHAADNVNRNGSAYEGLLASGYLAR